MTVSIARFQKVLQKFGKKSITIKKKQLVDLTEEIIKMKAKKIQYEIKISFII